MDIEKYNAHLPQQGAETPSFTVLAVRLASLTTSALALKANLGLLRMRIVADADRVAREAELCAEAEVEPQYVTQMTQAAQLWREVAKASADVEATADDMAAHARATEQAHEGEYRGIYEAVKAGGARQARPGFYRTS